MEQMEKKTPTCWSLAVLVNVRSMVVVVTRTSGTLALSTIHALQPPRYPSVSSGSDTLSGKFYRSITLLSGLLWKCFLKKERNKKSPGTLYNYYYYFFITPDAGWWVITKAHLCTKNICIQPCTTFWERRLLNNIPIWVFSYSFATKEIQTVKDIFQNNKTILIDRYM